MTMKLTLLTDWRFWMFVVTTISLGGSIFNFICGKFIASKIMNNDLKHVTADIDELKKNEKEFRVNLNKEIHQINLSTARIEKKLATREGICEERHKFDTKK